MRAKEDIIPNTMSETEFLLRQRNSFAFWNQYVMGLKMEPFIYEVSDAIQAQRKVVFAGPRYNTKSLMFSVSYPLWRAFNHETDGKRLQMVLYSSTAELAGKLLEEMDENWIEDNEFLRSIKPKNPDETWNVKEFKFNTNSRLLTKGYGSSTRGLHPDLIIVDDPFGDKMLFPHEFYMSYLKKSLMGMIGHFPDKQILVTGTIFSKNDMIWRLLQDDSWWGRYYPIYMNSDIERRIQKNFSKTIRKDVYSRDFDDTSKRVLAVKRWPWKAIQSFRRDMMTEGKDFAFRQEMLLEPVDDDVDALFNNDMIRAPEIIRKDLFFPEKGIGTNDAGEQRIFIISCDPAFSKKGDYCAFCVIEVLPNGKLRLVHLHHDKGMQEDEIIDYLKYLNSCFPAAMVVVEKNSILPILQKLELLGLPIFFPLMTREKKFKILLYQARSRFQNKSIEIPYGEGHTREMSEILLNELNSLRFIGNRLEGWKSHDDLAIAFSWGVHASFNLETSGCDEFFCR